MEWIKAGGHFFEVYCFFSGAGDNPISSIDESTPLVFDQNQFPWMGVILFESRSSGVFREKD
jgi:hypothetical protein